MLHTSEMEQLKTASSCAKIAIANLEFVSTTDGNVNSDAIKLALCSIKTTSAILSALITSDKDEHSDGDCGYQSKGGGRGNDGRGSGRGRGYQGKGGNFSGRGGYQGKGGIDEKDINEGKKFVFIANHVLKKEKYDITSGREEETAVEILTKDFQVDDVTVTNIEITDNGWKISFDSSKDIMDKTTYGHGSKYNGWKVKEGNLIFFKELKFNPSSSSTKE